ncbi:MAG: hypothetical protein CMM47_00675 [Rhodospirillaceae bacterium]|nr:hypothetical protein [Rhodospirillaceae bacterium]MBM84486.1 hypothetical protein [Rhodospirillaceae bacterium]MBM84523.1 hypothetical protein [Rhodospirillaceae bacterium]
MSLRYESNSSYVRALEHDDDPSFGEEIVDFAKYGIGSSLLSGGIGLINTATSLINVFGADIDQLDTGEQLESWGFNNAHAYYEENQTLVDGVGFVVSSLIPATLGLKGARAAQQALRASESTAPLMIGLRQALVPASQANKLRKAIQADALDIRSRGQQILAASKEGFHQAAVEGVFMETAILATNVQNPSLTKDDLTYFEAIGENLGTYGAGLIFGTGIGGVINTAIKFQTLKTIMKDSDEQVAELFKFGAIDSERNPLGILAGDRIAEQLRIYDANLKSLGEVNTGVYGPNAQGLSVQGERINATVKDELYKTVAELTGERSARNGNIDNNLTNEVLDILLDPNKLTPEGRHNLLSGLERITHPEEIDTLFDPAAIPTSFLKEDGWIDSVGKRTYGKEWTGSAEQKAYLRDNVMDYNSAMVHTEKDGTKVTGIELRDRVFQNGTPEEVTELLRHELAYAPAAALKDVFSNAANANLVEELVSLSKLVNKGAWNLVARSETVRKANAAAAGRSRQAIEEVAEMDAYLEAVEKGLRDPEQLIADAYNALTNPRTAKEAAEVGKTAYQIFAGNSALKTRLGYSEALLDTKTGNMFNLSDRTPTIRDTGKVSMGRGGVHHSQGITKINDAFNVLEVDPTTASAHYYAASQQKLRPTEKLVVDWTNFYAINKVIKAAQDGKFKGAITIKSPKGISNTITFGGTGDSIDRLKGIYQQYKKKAIADISNNPDSKYSVSDIARIVDVSEDYATFQGRGTGTAFWSQNYDPARPTVMKMHYKNRTEVTDPDKVRGLLDSRAAIAQAQSHAVANTNDFLFSLDPKLIGLMPESQIESGINYASTIGASTDAAGLLRSANSDYGSGASWAQLVGEAHNKLRAAGNNAIALTMEPVELALKAKPQALAEAAVLDPKLRQKFYTFTPDFQPDSVIADLMARRAGVAEEVAQRNINALMQMPAMNIVMNAASKNNTIWSVEIMDAIDTIVNAGRISKPMRDRLDALVSEDIITIQNKEVVDYWRASVKVNSDINAKGKQMIAGLKGLDSNINPDVLYPGALDPIRYRHAAFVIPTKGGQLDGFKRGIVGGPDDATLSRRINSLRDKYGNDITIVRTNEAENFFKQQGLFDSDFALNEWRANSDLRRAGLLADFMPEPTPQLVDSYRRDMQRQWGGVADNIMEMRYAEEVATLEQASKTIQMNNSALGPQRNKKLPDNFRAQLAVMFNKEDTTRFGAWRDVQENLDKGITTIVNTIRSMFKSNRSGVDYDTMNKYMDHYNVPRVYDDRIGELLVETEGLPEQVVNAIIPELNGAAATLMLRLDYIQPFVNAISTPITAFPEIKHLLDSIPQLQQQQINKTLSARVPASVMEQTAEGVPQYSMFSNMKLAQQAIKDFFQNPDLVEDYYKRGYSSSIVKEMRDVTDAIALDPRVLKEKGIAKYQGIGHKIVDTLATPADFSEEFVKFTAARMADILLTSAGITNGTTKHMAINTFVKRVHGNYNYAQRPALFKGITGQAIGLFQTYQFNLFQQLLRHIGDKQAAATSAMMGLQAGIFGAQSVPGFRAMNEFIAEKSQYQDDFYTLSQDAVGNEASEWILYGLASNFTKPVIGHGLELYTRGDLNPRTPFIIPTSIEEVPVYSMATKFAGSIMQLADSVANGAPMGQAMAEAMATNGVNRPLAGLGQMMSGARITTKGSALAVLQDMDWTQRVVRALGTKTLDESIAVQTYYRTQAYQTNMQERTNQLGRNMRTIMRAGSYDGNVAEKFLRDYTANGGTIDGYDQWLHRQAISATQSQIYDLYNTNDSVGGQYMQAVLGGNVPQSISTAYTNSPQ